VAYRRTLKLAAARLLSLTALDRALLAARGRTHGGAFIRGVNYHATPAEWSESFEAQLHFYAEHFAPVTPSDLAALLERGEWPHARPGLLLSFDDGLRTHYDVARPLIERYGFIGWFFVPTGFIECPVVEQAAFAQTHAIDALGTTPADGRIAMSWDEIRELDRRHVICSHTRSHIRLSSGLTPTQLDEEIVASRRDLEIRLNHPIASFGWVGGGERHGLTAAAATVIRSAGYRYSFTTASEPIAAASDPHQLHRTNIEADWPMALVRLQLCGIADWANIPKRRRIRRELNAPPAVGA